MCCLYFQIYHIFFFFFFQAEDGIRDLVRSRGLGDVYKRQDHPFGRPAAHHRPQLILSEREGHEANTLVGQANHCLLYTSDAADGDLV